MAEPDSFPPEELLVRTRHSRAQSLTETATSPDSYPNQPDYSHHTQPPASTSTSSTASNGEGLVRRHHTLGTSSSRLDRLERSRARIALQAVGLAEADQNYYLPPSPTHSSQHHSGWSDLGHGTTPAYSLALATAPAGGASSASTPTSWPKPVKAPPPSSKSSFQVIRGGRGDSALTDRVSRLPPPSPSSASSVVSAPSTGGGPGSTKLQHKNSLKPFLEAEAEQEGGHSEEWEQGLREQQERAGDLYADDEEHHAQYAAVTPPTDTSAFASPQSSPFKQHETGTKLLSHTLSVGHHPHAWRNSITPDEAALRRHQSLNSFRSQHEQAIAASAPGDGWEAFDNSSFARSRGVTTPAGLSLHHSNSLGSRSALSHSNSTGSNGRERSRSGALSPVGFPGAKSPWSPTFEETKQLGYVGTPVGGGTPPRGSLSRGSSTASPNRESSPAERRVGSDETPASTQGSFGTSQAGVNRSLSATAATTSTGGPSRRLPPLMTNPDTLAQLGQQPAEQVQSSQQAFLARQGPASAAAYVPPIGHSYPIQQLNPRSLGPTHEYLPAQSSQHPSAQALYQQHLAQQSMAPMAYGAFSAAPGVGSQDWSRQKESLVGPGGHVDGSWPAAGGFGVGLAIAQQQQIQALQNQVQATMVAMENLKLQSAQAQPTGSHPFGRTPAQLTPSTGPGSAYLPPLVPPSSLGGVGGPIAADSPIDIPSLIAAKGYNPTNFDLRPANARFFVIKSFQEEDVHKSIRHEIWSSTQLGNKRLDRAFRESADQGPIFLFFSVNASGHFAGMAQMITPVDESISSNVWASDKWKGILKVKWIFIRDVPLAALRHIRLSNTPENKPVTSSRDTQEVPYEQGCEMLKIISSFQSRTSLLQDFGWYEARQRANEAATAAGVAQPSPAQQPQRPPHYQQRQQQSTPSPQPGQLYQPQSQQQISAATAYAQQQQQQGGGRRWYGPGGQQPVGSQGRGPSPHGTNGGVY